jgi:hypothetical protein
VWSQDTTAALVVTLPGLLFAADLLAGLAAVILLWHRSSGPYFRADVPSR